MTYNLKYALDKEDYVAFQLFVASTSERIKKKRKRSRMIIAIMYMIIGILTWFTGDKIIGVVFLTLSVLWYLFYPKYSKYKYHKHYRSFVDESFKSHFNLVTSTRLSDNEIYSENSMGNTTVKVENVTEIYETGKYTFIRLGPGMGLIIPKEKIENIKDLEDWISNVIEKHSIQKQVDLDWSWK
jgi:hypothetical protein